MAVVALLLLAGGLALMLVTGWPSYAVLLLVAVSIAGVGLASGSVDPRLLTALPGRVVGLLEHDLLQAVALYAFVGALLRRVDLADRCFDAFASLPGGRRIGPQRRAALAGYGVALLAAPMNGSVGASTAMIGRSVLPHWRAAGLSEPHALALAAAGATLGAIVPPSLVLLLLGDAMLRAHTEGLNLSGVQGMRVMNTQDLIQAAGPPALMLAASWGLLALSGPRGDTAAAGEPAPIRSTWPGWATALLVAALLLLVALGWVRAVEAAAAAALAALTYAWVGGQLRHGAWARVLDDAMSLTGALFALMLAATTLSLVLRAAGCDRLVADALAHAAGQPRLAVGLVMAGLVVAGFVLDAFEMVFLVVPVVMPPLLAEVHDAPWVGCLALLALQAGFLLPPWGYAVLLVRAESPHTPRRLLARAIVPFLFAWLAVAAAVFTWPGITHWWRTVPDRLDAPGQPTSGDVDELLRSMSPPADDGER